MFAILIVASIFGALIPDYGRGSVLLVPDSEEFSCHDEPCINSTILCPNTLDTCDILCPHDRTECDHTIIYSAATTTTVTCQDKTACANVHIYCGDLASFASLSAILTFSNYSLTPDDFSIDCDNCATCSIDSQNDKSLQDSTVGCYGTAIDECIITSSHDNSLENVTLNCHTSFDFDSTIDNNNNNNIIINSTDCVIDCEKTCDTTIDCYIESQYYNLVTNEYPYLLEEQCNCTGENSDGCDVTIVNITNSPTMTPTSGPTRPSLAPSSAPIDSPSLIPSNLPSGTPIVSPTIVPKEITTKTPTSMTTTTTMIVSATGDNGAINGGGTSSGNKSLFDDSLIQVAIIGGIVAIICCCLICVLCLFRANFYRYRLLQSQMKLTDELTKQLTTIKNGGGGGGAQVADAPGPGFGYDGHGGGTMVAGIGMRQAGTNMVINSNSKSNSNKNRRSGEKDGNDREGLNAPLLGLNDDDIADAALRSTTGSFIDGEKQNQYQPQKLENINKNKNKNENKNSNVNLNNNSNNSKNKNNYNENRFDSLLSDSTNAVALHESEVLNGK